jgi:hypothetical protein
MRSNGTRYAHIVFLRNAAHRGKQMIQIQAVFEDIQFSATRDIVTLGRWEIKINDKLTRIGFMTDWSDVEVSAVMALATGIGEEQQDQELTAKLYAIAEPLFADAPKEVRMIP